MTGLLVLLVGVFFGGLQSGVLAQDGGKVSYPRALERLESLVASLNESLHETKEDLWEVRLCLNQTKKVLGEVQGESEVLRKKNSRLETQLAETRNELAATKTLHQLAIDELRTSQDSSRVEALVRQGSELVKELKRVRKNVSDLEDEQLSKRISAIESEQLPRQLNELTRDLRRLKDENLPRRVSSLALKLLNAEFRHNITTTRLKEEQRQIRSEVQSLETELETALTAQDEQVTNTVQELTDKQNALELKLDEVVIGEVEWESRIASSRVVKAVRVSVTVLDAALSNMTAVMGKGLREAKDYFGTLKGDMEVVENKLCEKVHNLTIIVEDAQESSEQSISAIKQDMARIGTLGAEQQRSIDRLNTQVTQQGQSVNQLSDSVIDQEERLDNLTSTVEEQGTCIARLKEDVEQIKSGRNTTKTTAEPSPQPTSVSQPSSVSGEAISTTTLASNFKFITPTPLPTPNPGSECEGTTEDNPSTSCEAIHECDPTAPSGYYWINSSSGVVKVLCFAGRVMDCHDAMRQGYNESGLYTVQPRNTKHSFTVYCDMETDGGGWTVLMKRQDGSVNFYLNWTDYKRGFGNLEGEHWLGLDNMYLLTHQSSDPPQLRVDLADWEGNTAFAKYDQLSVGDEDSDYTLSVSGYQNDSTAGDSLTLRRNGPHDGQKFSTPDRDNDESNVHCVQDLYHGPWWHRNCYDSLLTGTYYTGPSSSPPWVGISWHSFRALYYSLRYADMKIRPGGV